jgi:hypothetical protein
MQFNAHTRSDLAHVTFTLDEFDGACDPAFDNDLDELERQFAEFRLQMPNNS